MLRQIYTRIQLSQPIVATTRKLKIYFSLFWIYDQIKVQSLNQGFADGTNWFLPYRHYLGEVYCWKLLIYVTHNMQVT